MAAPCGYMWPRVFAEEEPKLENNLQIDVKPSLREAKLTRKAKPM